MATVKNVIVIGRKDSGKTTIANKIRNRVLPVDSNYERKASTSNDVNDVEVYIISSTVTAMNTNGNWSSRLYSFIKRQWSRLLGIQYYIYCNRSPGSIIYQVSRFCHYVFAFLLHSILAPMWRNLLSPVWHYLLAPVFHFVFVALRDNIINPIRHHVLSPMWHFWGGNCQLEDDPAFLDKYYFSKLPRRASLIIFVHRHGSRFTDERRKEMEGAIRTLNKESDVSSISALVITGCEGLTAAGREMVISEFKADSHTKFSANFMKKGIYCVGFPDIKILEPPLNTMFSDDIRRSHEELQTLLSNCNTTITVSKTATDM